jgi:hypothetical protein
MGFDFLGAFLTLFVLTAFGIGVFFLSRAIFKKLLKNASERLIFSFSIISVLVVTPLIIILILGLFVLFYQQMVG